MTANKGKARLGRGLSALIEEHLDSTPDGTTTRPVPVRSIVPNPFQPRREFKPEELADLEKSIAENGLLQPLVVRPARGAQNKFELVAGERRLRSVSRLGWSDVSVIVRDVDDTTLLVLALVENIQRQNLSPLEEAQGYKTLSEDFGLSQEEIATAVGRSRPTVANMLRLLGLPASVKRLLAEGSLSAGHARALLGVEDPVRAGDLGRRAAKEGWSVREMETQVRLLERGGDTGTGGSSRGKRARPAPVSDPVRHSLEEALRGILGTRVLLRAGRSGSGRISIPFADSEEFERIFELLAGDSPGKFID
jgi:ParB family chromosome partitioning protein